MPEQLKKRGLARNLISEAGTAIAVLALVNLAFLIYLDATRTHSNPYMGVLTWIVAPAILIFGLLIFVAGLFIERRRRRKRGDDGLPQYPLIDLNQSRTRSILMFCVIGGIVFVAMTVLGSYQAYHYTDSDAFCGTMCHSVMNPEYTVYKISPHARVGCVSCHIGPGPTWFLRSKLSGSYQVYSLLTNKYPRPIPTPVKNLRPARETCEQCHSPEKYFGTQLKTFDHFAYDETNTPQQVRMLIKTGGGNPATGPVSGIHWHMNLGNEITYIATDDHRQKIPWVRIRDRRTGVTTEYMSEEAKLTPAQIASMPRRQFDCVDCHSRPTHIYMSPDRAVDRALLAGHLDKSLPYVKQQGVAVLAKDYNSTPDALRTIAAEFPAYYQKTYPAVYTSKRQEIDRATVALQQIFSSSRFPEMRVDWRTHPDNAGHFMSIGCFRCHDDQHVSAAGKRISKDCQICHTVLGDKPDATFEHPIDLGDLRLVNCVDCHTGGGM